MPKKTAAKSKPLYRHKPAKAELTTKAQRREEDSKFHELPESHFKLLEDGSIQSEHGRAALPRRREETVEDAAAQQHGPTTPELIFSHDSPFIRLYHADCLSLLDAIAAKYPQGRFDAIFADPPYFLSNGGITCHAGRMVKVDKGDWDKSRGPELNHEFNLEWLRRCQRVLKPNGTIWVSGTHHVIFSIGYAMQQLGYKILNDIAWEKPNPPPNLSCRYFTHSTETILWAARDDKSKHVFNYQDMRKVTGKQMKTVWRDLFGSREEREENGEDKNLSSVWTLGAPGKGEKEHGKHPTQKPLALIERCLLASTNEGDLVLDPFLGGGITCRLMPDDALLVIIRETLFIIEVKFQQVSGSVDEKLQTCDFKRKQYQKMVIGIGLKVEYVYVLSDWFKHERYKDVLDYIISVNCHYKFNTLPLAWLGLPDPDIPTAAVEI